ncbi:unnamed protein product [Leptidea sinapis]|uniref:Uncharacterized protein n=1 Tax=Leptidea sinapis TaxID=189913 RepID=A0A5E4Q911_9NEOP|nr:unnamed protein product [Leptidea sinapis]
MDNEHLIREDKIKEEIEITEHDIPDREAETEGRTQEINEIEDNNCKINRKKVTDMTVTNCEEENDSEIIKLNFSSIKNQNGLQQKTGQSEQITVIKRGI